MMYNKKLNLKKGALSIGCVWNTGGSRAFTTL